MMKLWSMFLFWLRTRWNLQINISPKPLELSPADRELLEARAEQQRAIARATRLPITAIPEWRPDEPMVVGVDWAQGCDISAYTCSSCGFETAIVEDIVKHMKAHGATRLTVIPVTRPPAYRFGDRR